MPGGGSNLDLIDAAGRAGLPFVLTATETGAALAAVAQAEITGRPGACLTTLGPGVTSVVNGIACASLDRAPLLVFTDCYPSSAAAYEHQRLDHRALLAPVTKWSAPLSPENADDVIAEAIERAMAAPPGPVHIDVPSDVAGKPSRRGGPAPVLRELVLRQAQDERVEECLPRPSTAGGGPYDRISRARRPLLLIGLGARTPDAVAAIRAFCGTHRVPAMVTYKAKGVMPDQDAHFAGVLTNAAVEQPILAQADLFIGVGLDPVELLPRPWTHQQPIVSIGPWRVHDQHLPLAAQHVGDVATGLRAMGEGLTNVEWDFASLREEVEAQHTRLDANGDRLTPASIVRTAAKAARGARLTLDAGAHMLPAAMLWPVDEPNGMLVSNGLSTMGFALPAAIGAALIDRDRPVVALTGDGGLLICAGELLTAAREGLRVITVVFSDASLSLIAVKQQQRKLASAGVSLGEVAWCALAESLGVTSHLASTEGELESAMRGSLARQGPSLIEAPIDPSHYADVLRAVRG